MTEDSRLYSEIHRYASAIEAAIEAAADAGFELDNGYGVPIFGLELNHIENEDFSGDVESVEINVPYSFQ